MNKAVKGVVGFLGVLVLLGIGITSCGIANPLASDASTPSTGASKADGQLQLPERTVYEQGQVEPSPGDTPYPPSPSATARSPRTRTSTVPSTLRPSPTCPGRVRIGVMSGLTVVPSADSATVTWLNAGIPAQTYLVAAVPTELVYGFQPPINWQTVPAPSHCGTVSATVTGLDPGTRYIFWLRAITTDTVYGGTTDTWVARSIVVTTAS